MKRTDLQEEIMRKLFWTLMMVAIVTGLPAVAQDTTGQKSERQISTYRLSFNFNELEDGKKINTRSYTMLTQDENAAPDAWTRPRVMKVGTRVPVTTDNKGQVSTVYVDATLSIFCRVRPHGSGVDVDGNVELSSLAQPDQAASGRPVLRTVESGFGAEVALGKPMLITSIDDVNSARRYEVELTATRLK